nr:MAG TPA: Exonuclease [Caudoviricetes sp.]
MILTNHLNLPEQIVNAVKKDDYNNNGTYSATTLLKDPKEIILFNRHKDEITEDVSEHVYSLLGTSVHYILEKAEEGENQFKEERLYYKFGNDTISGKFDFYDMEEEMLGDYKVTTVYKYLLGDNEHYRFQLLTYAYLLRKNGFPCKGGRIYQIFRDWQRSKAKFDKSYPQKPVNVITFRFYDKDFTYIENEIQQRLANIHKYEDFADDEIPICSKENRWATDDKFAVMKKGRKSAMRILNSKEEAEEWMKNNGGEFIQERPAESRKCVDYCSCCEFCNFWRENYGQG